MSTADYAFQYYVDKGWSPYAAAGIVGNFMAESGLNPNTIHDRGTGFGIAGWRDEKPGVGRKSNLIKFAKDNKLNPRDLDTQLAFGDYELRNSEKHVGDMLQSAGSADDASHAMIHYERPKGYNPDDVTQASGYQSRMTNSRSLLTNHVSGDSTADYRPPAAPAADTTQDMVSGDNWVEPAVNPNEGYSGSNPDNSNWDVAGDMGEGTTPARKRSKFSSAMAGAAQAGKIDQAYQADTAFTPTPNTDVLDAPTEGVDINAYQQYAGLFANGGVVHELSISDFFSKVMGRNG